MKRQIVFAGTVVLALASLSSVTGVNAAGHHGDPPRGQHERHATVPAEPGGGGADTTPYSGAYDYCGPMQWLFGGCGK